MWKKKNKSYYVGLVISYVGLIISYIGDIVSYVGLIISYVGDIISYVGNNISYVDFLKSHVDVINAGDTTSYHVKVILGSFGARFHIPCLTKHSAKVLGLLCFGFQAYADCTSTGPECISSCVSVPSGNYQSCETCEGYVACSGGILYDMPCPVTTFWDDVSKVCLLESTTCNGCQNEEDDTETTTIQCRWYSAKAI